MKPNVDLTSNQMFSGQHHSLGDLKVTLTERDEDSCFKFEGIRTGNKEERELKRLCDNAVSGDYCDRCGLLLNTTPWSGTLCKKCEKLLEREYGSKNRCPWYKLDNEMIPNGKVVSLLWQR